MREKRAFLSVRFVLSLSLSLSLSPNVSNSSESNFLIERKIGVTFTWARTHANYSYAIQNKTGLSKTETSRMVTFTAYLVLSSRLRGF